MNSSILEDDWGFHIVRVVERREESYDPFTTVQAAIRDKMIKERTQKARSEFVDNLRKNTYISMAIELPTPQP